MGTERNCRELAINLPRKDSRQKKWLAGAGSAIALVASGTALATEETAWELEEIIVTANRTESELSKTAVAVSAISGDALISAGITNPTELAGHMPGLSVDRANGLQLTIRGVSSTDNSEKGDPSAAFLLDGIYIARPQAQEVAFYDLERTEVVRGPQGTLYGRNTTAGLINVISARPEHEFDASINASLGDFSSQHLSGMLNLPIGESVAVRAAVNYAQRDTYLIKNPDNAFDSDPMKDDLSARLSASFKFNSATELLLRVDYSQMQGNAWREDNFSSALLSNLYEMPLVAPPAGQRGTDPRYIGGDSESLRRITYTDSTAIDIDNDTWGIMAEFNWKLSENNTLTYLGSRREYQRDEAGPLFLGSVAPGIDFTNAAQFTGSYDQMSHEMRLAYDGERLDLQTGLYYFKETSGIQLALLGLIAPNPGDDGYVFGFPQDPTESESRAVFGQGTFGITDRVRLTAGVRYTDDDKSRLGATVFHRSLDEPIDFVASPTNPAPDSLNQAAVAYERTTWKTGLEFDPTDKSLLYVNVSTGYKAGGFNDGCLAGELNCNTPVEPERLFYGPEELTAYELGFRTEIGSMARIFAAYFHYDYTDLQLSQVANFGGGPVQVTTNAGEAEVDGIELEAQIQPNERNLIDAGISWLDAVYTDYEIVPGVNLAGDRLNHSPELAATLGYRHTVPVGGGGLVFDIHSRYVDEYFVLSSALVAQFAQPGYTKTDVTIGYHAEDNRWYVEAFGKNLEDEVTLGNPAVSASFPGLNNGTVTLGAPRTYGMRMGYNF